VRESQAAWTNLSTCHVDTSGLFIWKAETNDQSDAAVKYSSDANSGITRLLSSLETQVRAQEDAGG